MAVFSPATLVVAAVGVAILSSGALALATRRSSRSTVRGYRLVGPVLVAKLLLSAGVVTESATRTAPYLIGDAVVAASTAHRAATLGTVLGLSACLVGTCWLIGVLARSGVRSVRRRTWWW